MLRLKTKKNCKAYSLNSRRALCATRTDPSAGASNSRSYVGSPLSHLKYSVTRGKLTRHLYLGIIIHEMVFCSLGGLADRLLLLPHCHQRHKQQHRGGNCANHCIKVSANVTCILETPYQRTRWSTRGTRCCCETSQRCLALLSALAAGASCRDR